MRLIASTLLAAVAVSFAVTAAEAQSRRPLRITVQPRSYLDAGKVAPVGSLQHYATVDRYSPMTPPTVSFSRADAALPPRIGGGRNPFGPIDWTP